ncbi:hypothetical protein WDU99_12180 [Microbacterium sp. Mu-80]|uniref:Uncharacterized protein n=1 Tax=Microbacterium bandirmense TaxID=3122050 RepID=A0ABU8LDM0_9MICO
MTAVDRDGVRYPRSFEIYRLEALGDDPYLTIDEARAQYEQGRGLTVVPDEQPPGWSIHASPKAYRFTVTFHSRAKKMIRKLSWEQVDGMLFCRRSIDRFYPAGEQQLPLVDVVTVTQDFSADGLLNVTVSAPDSEDEFHQAEGIPTDGLRLPVPVFGEWHPLLEASRPAELERAGAEAITSAREYAAHVVATGDPRGTAPTEARSGWRIPADAEQVLRSVDAIVANESANGDVPVIVRGGARIVPLAMQADPTTSGLDPREERHRMELLAASIRDACDQRGGQSIRFDLEQVGDGTVAAYAAALRAAGAAQAHWWVFDSAHGAALVRTGSADDGDLALALHLVPPGWVYRRRSQSAPATGEIDVRWTWSDLVAAAERRRATAGAAEQNEKDSQS